MNANDYDSLFANSNDILFVKNENGDYIFRKSFNVVANADSTRGSVSGAGKYRFSDSVQLNASAKSGYHFVKWSDNTTENPKNITIGSSNVDITAYFEEDYVPPEPTPPEPTPPEPTPPEPEPPTPILYVSMILSHYKGTVTCSVTPSDAVVTWSSGKKSKTSKSWTHSSSNGTETVTFTAEKEGYVGATKSMRIKKSTTSTPYRSNDYTTMYFGNNWNTAQWLIAAANSKVSYNDSSKPYWKSFNFGYSNGWTGWSYGGYVGWFASYNHWKTTTSTKYEEV